MVLQKLFFAKEKLKAANALHAFLSTTTEGLCAVIGQYHIYTAAQIHIAKVAALQQEVEQLLWEEYTGKAEDKILAIAKKEMVFKLFEAISIQECLYWVFNHSSESLHGAQTQ